jgi:hypothetical protein
MTSIRYKVRGVNVSIDGHAVVELPCRVFRGRLFADGESPAIEGLRGMAAFCADHAGLAALLVADTTGRAEAAAARLRDHLPATTRLAVHGCGALHAGDRRLELFLFEGAIDPAPRPGCAAGGCLDYQTWLARTVETVDLRERAPAVLPGFLALELTDQDGEPVPRARFQVTASDGSVREGRLDERGRARLDPLPPGLCRVTFPELDSGAWEAA